MGRHRRWHGCFAHKAFRVCLIGLCQDVLTGGMDGVGLAVMHLVRGHQADAEVMVILVVPGEEAAAEAPGILDAAETFRELRLVFQMGWTAPTASSVPLRGSRGSAERNHPR